MGKFIVLTVVISVMNLSCSINNDEKVKVNEKLVLTLKPQPIAQEYYRDKLKSVDSCFILVCNSIDYNYFKLNSLIINDKKIDMYLDTSFDRIHEDGSPIFSYYGISGENLNKYNTISITINTNQGLTIGKLQGGQVPIDFIYGFGDTISGNDTIKIKSSQQSDFTIFSIMTYSLLVSEPCSENHLMKFTPIHVCDTILNTQQNFSFPISSTLQFDIQKVGTAYSIRTNVLVFNGALAESTFSPNFIGADSIFVALYGPSISKNRSIIKDGLSYLKNDSCISKLISNGNINLSDY